MIDTPTLAQLRRANLLSWMSLHTLNQTKVAEELGVGRAYVSLLFKPSKHFGEKSARSIEQKLHMPPGYLDANKEVLLAVEDWSKPEDLHQDVAALVPRMYIETVANSQVTCVKDSFPPLAFSQEWLKSKSVTKKENLRLVKVTDNSMAPFLNADDVALVDLGQAQLNGSDAYALQYGTEVRVKRVSHRFDGGLLIRSDNEKFADEILKADDLKNVAVLGRVLWRAG